jgi:hypothetical protein
VTDEHRFTSISGTALPRYRATAAPGIAGILNSSCNSYVSSSIKRKKEQALCANHVAEDSQLGKSFYH